jgi:hypothetical protein
MLRTVLDRSAADGERLNAADKLRESLLRRNAKLDELTANGAQPAPDARIKANWGTYQMPWGVHKGEMLADLDLSYLMRTRDWLRELKARGDLNGRNVQVLETLNNYLKC